MNSKKYTNRKIFYSLTEDNKFLPETYVMNLKKNLSPLEARRKLRGEWIDDPRGSIYSEYRSEIHYKKDTEYIINKDHPVYLSWDFNIGKGKPLSMCIAQFIDDHFHFYQQSVIEGARTTDSCEDIISRGLLDHDNLFYVNGDATGKARSTKSLHSDYDIIEKILSNYIRPCGTHLNFKMDVGLSNPPVKTRHNEVNSYLKNELGEYRVTVYGDAPMIDKGFRLTRLKPGGSYIEDDANEYQHITTAVGYLICRAIRGIDNNIPDDAVGVS
jgi:hypothetical protein